MRIAFVALVGLIGASTVGCRRYVKSRELAPIPPVDDHPIPIGLAPQGGGERALARIESWLAEVEPRLAPDAKDVPKDQEKARLRLEASRQLNNALPQVGPDDDGTRALALAARVASAEAALGADGATEIAAGLYEQLLLRRKGSPAVRIALARLYSAQARFAEAITTLEGDLSHMRGSDKVDALWLLAVAKKSAGRGSEALASLHLYLAAVPGDARAKAMEQELAALVAKGDVLPPVTAPPRDWSVEVAGLKATYKNLAHKWTMTYPVNWMIGGQLARASRFDGSYLGLVVPVSEGPAQAGFVVYSTKLAAGGDAWAALKDSVLRVLGGAMPKEAARKSVGKLDLQGEQKYFTGETTQLDERLRYEVWITRGGEEAYAVVVLAPVARWFEIRDEVSDALQTLSLP